jgi:uncharacterized protein
LLIAGSTAWKILWGLILGVVLSAAVQTVVRRSAAARLPGEDSPRTLAAAMVFEVASTNLAMELGIVLALLMGWRFTVAEVVGGPVMIVGLAVLLSLTLRARLRR